MGMCLKAICKLLYFQSQNLPEKQCILDALAITTVSNTCNFMGFMQLDEPNIGGPELASVADNYWAIFIDFTT